MAIELALDKVRLETADGVATIVLNDPDAMNVMGYRMAADLRQAAERAVQLLGIRALLVCAEGKHFCGGGDLKAMQETFAGDPKSFFDRALVDIHAAVLAIYNAPVPVVVAVQGFAAGAGANIPLAGDLVIAGDDAQFFQAFVQVGLSVDSGGTYFLPRALGDKRAMYYLLTGTKLKAPEAFQLGLVSKVVPVEQLQDEARRLVRQLAEGPTQAYAQIKRLVQGQSGRGLATHLDEELASQLGLGSTADFQTGVNAFLNKDLGKFEGR